MRAQRYSIYYVYFSKVSMKSQSIRAKKNSWNSSHETDSLYAEIMYANRTICKHMYMAKGFKLLPPRSYLDTMARIWCYVDIILVPTGYEIIHLTNAA